MIEGDNFQVLTSLNLINDGEGLIDVIYIDPPYNTGKKDLNNLMHQVKLDIEIKEIINKSLKKITHPLFTDYEKLREISLDIVRMEELSSFGYESEDTEAILYYVPTMWEKYLDHYLFNQELRQGLNVNSQAKLSILDGLSVIRPDFVVYNQENNLPLAVFDAKFKPGWSIRRGFNLDDYTKVIRDANAFNRRIAGVIFPSNNYEIDTFSIKEISVYNQEDRFVKIAIMIPELDDLEYHHFLRILKNNVEHSKRNLIDNL